MTRAVLLVLAGLALGFLLGRWTAGPASPPDLDTRGVLAAPARPPDPPEDARLAGSPSPPVTPAPPAPEPPPEASATHPGEAAPPGAAAWDPLAVGVLEVRIDAPEGTGWRGNLYALPAGSPGVDDVESVPNAWVDEGELGQVHTLPLPWAGTWDVGYVAEGVHVMVEDVAVGAGAKVPVMLTLPPCAPITVRFADPTAAAWARGREVWVGIGEEGGTHSVPGRGERRAEGTWATIRAEQEWVSSPLAAGPSYRIQVAFSSLPDGAGESGISARMPSPHWGLDPERTQAKAGETVLVRLVERATLRLRVALSGPPPPSWAPGESYRVTFTARTDEPASREAPLMGFGPEHPWDLEVDLSADLPHVSPESVEIELPPGVVDLAWVGPACRPGNLDRIALRGGETTERAVVVEPTAPTAEASEASPELVVRVEGEPSAEPEPFLHVWAALPDPGTGDEPLEWIGDPTGRTEVREPGLAMAPRLAGALGRDRAARPALLDPVRKEAVLTFEPAGHLVVVPSRIVDPRLGQRLLRRADGLPAPVGAWWFADSEPDQAGAVFTFPATPGALVGPLPVGTYRFEILLGRMVVGHATGTVVAGRIEVLRVP